MDLEPRGWELLPHQGKAGWLESGNMACGGLRLMMHLDLHTILAAGTGDSGVVRRSGTDNGDVSRNTNTWKHFGAARRSSTLVWFSLFACGISLLSISLFL